MINVVNEKYKYPYNTIKDILYLAEENINNIIDKYVKVAGWVRSVREQGKDTFAFCSLNDGTTSDCLQVIINKENDSENDEENFSDFYNYANTGCSIRVEGNIIKSPANGQLIELIANKIFLEGKVENSGSYPIAKTRINLDTLRNYCHLRARTNTFGCIFRIRSNMMYATHQFYQEHGFLHLDPNVITVNECEGGAGVFTVSEMFSNTVNNIPTIKDSDNVDWKKDHFEKKAFLTVSSQLQLEALACSLGNVYTTNKSFRSEHSLTSKHVSEFTHLEIEQCFTSFDDLMNIAEDYVKFVLEYIKIYNTKDLNVLNAYTSRGLT